MPQSHHLVIQDAVNRRAFLKQSGVGLGALALGSLLGNGFRGLQPTSAAEVAKANLGGLGFPNYAPKYLKVIILLYL